MKAQIIFVFIFVILLSGIGSGQSLLPPEKVFGFRVQSRAQTFGTFKLLFNAIHTSRTKSAEKL